MKRLCDISDLLYCKPMEEAMNMLLILSVRIAVLQLSSEVSPQILERLSMTLRQTANGKNETFAVCLQLSVPSRVKIFVFAVNSRRHFSIFV